MGLSVVEYILDGLEAALELERELGVRIVEIDRGLLGGCGRSGVSVGRSSSGNPHGIPCIPSLGLPPADVSTTVSAAKSFDSSSAPGTQHQALSTELVFLHDRPLSPKGVEMMAKILTALGKSDAPIVVVPPAPKAKITVVLGGLALKKYFTGMRGEPGQWQKTPEGRDVLITYSPEYILRFGTVTPAVQKIKQDMWLSLKAVKQRLAS